MSWPADRHTTQLWDELWTVDDHDELIPGRDDARNDRDDN